MGRKLYVGNLPFDTGDDELKLAFAQCGTVTESKVVKDGETGRSRGFGFVTMASEGEARDAVARWSGKPFGGRQLKVNEAVDKPRGDRPPGGQGRPQQGGYSGGTYVMDLPPPERGRGGGRGRGRQRPRGDDYG